MLKWIRPRLLRWLRVPADPEPPLGASGSIRVFRAGARFFYIRLFAWLVTQIGAAVGIAISLVFIAGLRSEYEEALATRASTARPAAQSPASVADNAAPEADVTTGQIAPATDETRTKLPREARTKRNRERAKQAFFERVPQWTITAVEIGELVGITFFLVQLPFTFAAVRLDWELRWYIVTDRSLRIRAGLWSLQESTMSFANLQQVEVRQGPLQRLLAIADVRVQSAGGGGGGAKGGHDHDDSLHTGIFHGVDNAQEVRDLILERLRSFREAGLGDPDDHTVEVAQSAASLPSTASSEDTLKAARELLEEARALRRTLT
jgi:hypothetical protein